MRLYLLPISTRRTFIYGQRLNVVTTEKQTWLDKGTGRAARLWASWEKKDAGWQRKVVDYGNKALKRIPYEEWGLKSIPPLAARREVEELSDGGKVEVVYPSSLIPDASVPDVLHKLGTDRQELHRKRMIYCFIGMPISAPVALLPVIPNLPFFYLVFRAWSHWRALSGSKHIQYLLEKHLAVPKPSRILDEIYSKEKKPFTTTSTQDSEKASGLEEGTEVMILNESIKKQVAEALNLPELEIELDRAIWQVEKAIESEKDLKDEKARLDKANAAPKE